MLIPYWSLGWNQCRYGYFTQQYIIDSVRNYTERGIPLDVQWNDIDYLEIYRDFTYSSVSYKDLPTIVEDFHSINVRYVPIIDGAVAHTSWQYYPEYDNGHY